MIAALDDGDDGGGEGEVGVGEGAALGGDGSGVVGGCWFGVGG